MKIIHIRKLILVLPMLLALSACGGRKSQQTNDADIRIIAAVESTQVAQTELNITLSDTNGDPINDASISVKGDMSHAGMVPVQANSSSGLDGVYKMPFEWTMGGDWVVTVDVVLSDGRSATQQFDFSITN